MSSKSVFGLMIAKKKFVGCLLTIAMVLSIGSVPSKAVAATDAEIIAMIQSILAVIQQIRNQINTQTTGTPTGLTQAPDKFPDSVTMGSTNDSILLVQKILATDSTIYPSGLTTGTFGNLTAEGLRNFQTKFHLPVTGTFTPETEYVLNNVLSAVSLDSYPQNYLTNTAVTESINTATDAYLLPNTLVNGKVALRTSPVFSTSTKSSDTAILQRIMKTDTQIFKGEVTGLMDSATIAGVIKLRNRYSTPYAQVTGVPVVMSELMNAQTLTIVNRILTANDSANIKETLLSDSSVAPATLLTASERTIESISAVKNYLLNETKVNVIYVGKTSEKFTIPLIKPESSVIDRIATKLNRPVSQVSGKVTFSATYDKIITKIDLTLKPANRKEADIVFTYLDETTELKRTTDTEVQKVIDLYFNGSEDSFLIAMDGYILDTMQGYVSDDLVEFLSDVTGVDESKVRSMLTVKLDQTSSDPSGGGGS